MLNLVKKKLIAVADPLITSLWDHLPRKTQGACQDDKLLGWNMGGVVRHRFSVLLYDHAAIYSNKVDVILIKTVFFRFEKKL